MNTTTYNEWEADHADNNYPFASEKQLVTSRGIMIPQGVIVDACLARYGTEPVWLSKIVVSPTAIAVGFASFDEKKRKIEISGSIDLEDIPSSSLKLYMGDSACGYVVFGRNAITEIKSIPQGSHSFVETEFYLEASCSLSLGKRQVSAIRVGQENYRGKIIFSEGEGVRIVAIPVSGGYTVRVDAVGKALGEDCCPDDYEPLETISGVSPDPYGNLNIEPKKLPEPTSATDDRQLIRVVAIDGGIKIELAR